MAREVQAIYTYEDWCKRIIGCDKHYNFFMLHKVEQSDSLVNDKNNLIPVQLQPTDKEKVRQKHLLDNLEVDTSFDNLKQSFCTSYEDSQSFFDSIEDTLTAVRNFLFGSKDEILPEGSFEKIDFGTIHVSVHRVIEIRNAIKHISENDEALYKNQNKCLFIVPGDDVIIEAKAYLKFYHWLDSICHLISGSFRQVINRAGNKKHLDEFTLNDFQKLLKLYFNENLVSIFQGCYSSLLAIPDLCLFEDFVNEFQYYFFNKCLNKCLSLLEPAFNRNPSTIAKTYKELLEILSLCNAQSRNRLLVNNNNEIEISNQRIVNLLHFSIREFKESYGETLDSNPIPGLTFRQLLFEIFSTHSEMYVLVSNKKQGEFFDSKLKPTALSFNKEMQEKYSSLYPTFLNLALIYNKKHNQSFSEIHFIEHALIHIDEHFLNLDDKGLLIIPINETTKYEFEADYYNQFIRPLFSHLHKFLKIKLSKINGINYAVTNFSDNAAIPPHLRIFANEGTQKVLYGLRQLQHKPNDVDFIELITSLYLELEKKNLFLQFSRNDFIEFISAAFGISIKDIDSKLSKAIIRKSGVHPFMDKLIKTFETYSNEKAEKNNA